LLVSFLLNLVVPKFIDELQYANWQSYVLYVGYVGVLHFGLLDGLVLRYSKYDYDELDKERIRSQFILLLTIITTISFVGIIISACVFDGSNKLIFILVSVGIIIKNIATYSQYTFQITNRISKYAIQVISQRVTYGLIVLLLLLLRVNDFYWYCIAELAGDTVGIIIASFFNKGLYFGKSICLREALKELKVNISAGIILLFANWSALLMTGGAKMIIQWRWDKLLFGQVSFAFSVSNLFLVFVSAISVVLFPSLSRIDPEKLPQMYKQIRGILSPILFFVMIFYFLGCVVLNLWLPKYSDSLIYLGILLPIIIYSSKVSLLTNNYLKVYRKEKLMLLANVISIVVGAGLFVLCAYGFTNLYALLCCVVFVIMLNSVLSEIFVMKTIHIVIIKDFILELLMTVGFILCASLLSLTVGCLVYTGLFLIYCAFNYKSIIVLFKNIFSRIKRKQ
jgi:O-antigen/teichoic acid export membrane protein